MSVFVGLDVSLNSTSICMIDADDRTHRTQTWSGPLEDGQKRGPGRSKARSTHGALRTLRWRRLRLSKIGVDGLQTLRCAARSASARRGNRVTSARRDKSHAGANWRPRLADCTTTPALHSHSAP
jgi:hypothetical protein